MEFKLIEAVSNWSIPKGTKDVRKLLGFTGYFKHFVEGYSPIVCPLNDLLVGLPTNPGEKMMKSEKATHFRWDDEQQCSFDTIRERLTNPSALQTTTYHFHFIQMLQAMQYVLPFPNDRMAPTE